MLNGLSEIGAPEMLLKCLSSGKHADYKFFEIGSVSENEASKITPENAAEIYVMMRELPSLMLPEKSRAPENAA